MTLTYFFKVKTQTLLLSTNIKSHTRGHLITGFKFHHSLFESSTRQLEWCYCTIMYCEQTSGPRSANFWTHMYADKLRLPENFHQNRSRPWPSFSWLKIRMDYIDRLIMPSSFQANTGRMDETNRFLFKGCQEWRWTTFRQDMSRGVGL